MSYEEGVVCLYKDGEAKNFSAHEVKDALDNGWQDEPNKARPRGRPRKTVVEDEDV